MQGFCTLSLQSRVSMQFEMPSGRRQIRRLRVGVGQMALLFVRALLALGKEFFFSDRLRLCRDSQRLHTEDGLCPAATTGTAKYPSHRTQLLHRQYKVSLV